MLLAASKRIAEQDSRIAELESKLQVVPARREKPFIHARLATPAGDRGCLTLYGGKPEEHHLFAEHVAGAETWVATEGHGRTLHEWRLKPAKPDNRWLDCLVGCAVAASMCGVRHGVEGRATRTRPKLRLWALQQGRAQPRQAE